ncbi:uncharacterized protein ARMOST_12501 [Armillaria ostoyae]|uniref:Uncharacterized protein n=1 Tax=Armillaria ostoyae TaxID=47428 RepID=A0A284RK67_ARMOS|nr:uncharacterized protein ARMOST_12501 [Armillaria ostoyae]
MSKTALESGSSASRHLKFFSVWTSGTTLSIFSPQAYSIATPPLSQFSHGTRRKYFATEREQWRRSGRRRTLDLTAVSLTFPVTQSSEDYATVLVPNSLYRRYWPPTVLDRWSLDLRHPLYCLS